MVGALEARTVARKVAGYFCNALQAAYRVANQSRCARPPPHCACHPPSPVGLQGERPPPPMSSNSRYESWSQWGRVMEAGSWSQWGRVNGQGDGSKSGCRRDESERECNAYHTYCGAPHVLPSRRQVVARNTRPHDVIHCHFTCPVG
jgi:hypothetical protein